MSPVAPAASQGKYIQEILRCQEIIRYRLEVTDQETEDSAINQQQGLAMGEALG